MPILKIKLGTWNMQKGPGLESVEESPIFDAVARSARHQMLGWLLASRDITFIQEPASDLRDKTQTVDYSVANEKVWMSYDKKADNQVHASANRPAYYASFTIQRLDIPSDCPVNGNEDAFRLSAMGAAVTSVGKGLFISLHATSGYGAKKNTRLFVAWLCKWVKEKHADTAFILIGADFNHKVNGVEYEVEGCHVSFKAPTGMTQQSGSSLDGFCCITVDPAIGLKWWEPLRACTGEIATPIQTKMVMTDRNKQQGVNQRGYVGLMQSGPMPGTVQALSGPEMWTRMSDHCPVVCEVDISRPD